MQWRGWWGRLRPDTWSAPLDCRAMQEKWSAVDDYITTRLIGSDPILDAALVDSDAAGLPPISVTAAQGKLLFLLAKLREARNILEIGTLGGYSAIWMARALPEDGKLTTLEISALHARSEERRVGKECRSR